MARYLLDSDAVIDYVDGRPPVVALIQGLYDRADQLCTCDIVVTEVYAGLRPNVEQRAEQLLEALVFLTTPLEAAGQAGRWRYLYARRGITLPTTDTLIAATALAHDATVITGNLADYPMPEVSVLPLPRDERRQ